MKIAGVESSQSLGVSAAVAAGRIVRVPVGDTIADGLAANLEPGSITPGLVTDTQLVAVDDAELCRAMRWLYANHGVVAEGSGAAGLAAVLGGKLRSPAASSSSSRGGTSPPIATPQSSEAARHGRPQVSIGEPKRIRFPSGSKCAPSRSL